MKASKETLEAMQRQTENVRKHIADFEAGDKNNYWSRPTEWMKKASEYGAENIFMISSSYRSHAYDDYASFTYYNQATQEEFEDSWTTAAACPGYSLYECMKIDEAFKKGLLDEEKYVDFLKQRRLMSLEDFIAPTLRVGDFIEYKIRVEVTGGRKWKGTGYALSCKSVKFGYHEMNYVSILDPETNVIHEISDNWVHPAEDVSKMIELYKEWARKRIETMTSDSLRIDNNNRLTVDIDSRFYEWLRERAESIEIDLSSAVNPALQERDKRKEEFKTKKMAELVEWVKKNTDKEGDAIKQLAEHIFQKRYA